ncbi:MAG: PD-(D/E)XK nuclease domain-containing protein [Planctomycetaceae bacterium]|jgi:hypothetical protein|nr:PD-(D/E)XK nuclease domain-containing protein [Planctomycetaceae bacterium]
MPKRPIRFFNTTGPCNPDDHYMLPPAERLQGAQLHRYVRDELYWSLHAPRQTGKTTFLQSWAKEINAGGKAVACYVSVERCQPFHDVERAMPEACVAIQEWAANAGLPVPKTNTDEPGSVLSSILINWAGLVVPQPLIVLFDEVDVLENDAMISFLRQLRGGFASRGVGKFPVSIALVGMHDLEDWLISIKGGKALNPGSPFNIKERSVTISNFVKKDIVHLFAQRTEETGQQIEPAALDYVWEQSQGQPWIVNNLFKRATMEILDEEDYQTVTLAHIQQAREQMILDRETHLKSVAFRMELPRVRNVVEKLLTGEVDINLAQSENFRFCLDLGLVANNHGEMSIANPIYREVLARDISYGAQVMMPKPTFRWQKPDGSLDMDSLLKEFQGFWQENSEIWEENANYTEAFPHLLLMAFLQRITNGSGRIEREYAAGRKRMDLAIEYNGKWNIIEIKLLRDRQTFDKVKAEGLKQIIGYRDSFSSSLRMKDSEKIPCYLIIFDRRSEDKKSPWEQRITWNAEGGVTVIGC